MRARLVPLLCLVTVSLPLVLGGCGGSGASTGAKSRLGGLKLNITWPKPDRHIPKLTQRLRLTIHASGSETPLADQSVEKPSNGETQSVVQFKDLPTDTQLVLECEARGGESTTDDVLLGTAADSLQIRPGVPAVAVLNLQSTIDHLELKLNGTVPGSQFQMFRKESATITVTAKDASGGLVPIAPGSLTLSTTGQALSIINDPTPLLKSADVLGNGELIAVEAESGKSTQVSVSVQKRPGVQSVEIVPSGPLTIVKGQSLQVAAKGFDEDHVQVNDATFTFSLANANGVSIAGNVVTGLLGGGSATLIAKEDASGVQATTTVSVLAHGKAVRLAIFAPVLGEIPDTGLGVQAGSSTQLSAVSLDEFGNEADPVTNVTWVLDDPNGIGIFSLSPTGLLSADRLAIFGAAAVEVRGTILTASGPVSTSHKVPVFIQTN